MSNTRETYLNSARVAELWATIQTALGKKADTTALAAYATPESVSAAIASTIADYPDDAAVKTAIAAALADYMTASEVNAAIASAVSESANIQFKVVEALPEAGEPNVIYLVPNAEDNGIKDQSMWIDGGWVSIGNTQVDLSGYWNRDNLQALTAEELQAILV